MTPRDDITTKPWHLLDARPIWVKELAGALSERVSLTNWIPEISWGGWWQTKSAISQHPNPPLTLHHFPLQRGFAKWPLRWLVPEGRRLARRLLTQASGERSGVLICVSPHYASVAELWPGPVIYYMSDLYYAWGDDPAFINYLDRRICQRANLVCPVSPRGQEYLLEKANCPEAKIAISPMATRAGNVLAQPIQQPTRLPTAIADMSHPLVAIIGNLARNTDWLFLEEAVRQLADFSFVFVGSTEMAVPEADHWQARERLQQHGGRVRFVGAKPYHELADYARSCDLALLPYRKIEPTYSGSSTRFFEHLAASRPMYATHGFAELLTKEPLVHLVENADHLVREVRTLQARGFVDGIETDRWQASHQETWEARAEKMIEDLCKRCGTMV